MLEHPAARSGAERVVERRQARHLVTQELESAQGFHVRPEPQERRVGAVGVHLGFRRVVNDSCAYRRRGGVCFRYRYVEVSPQATRSRLSKLASAATGAAGATIVQPFRNEGGFSEGR